MTPRELPKYEVLFSLKRASDLSFSSFFLILTWLAGSGPFSLGERIRFESPFLNHFPFSC